MVETLIFILKVAAGCFIGACAYNVIIGFPGARDGQLQFLANQLEAIEERLESSGAGEYDDD